MDPRSLLLIVVFLAILAALTPPLGKYLADVVEGKRTLLSPVLGPLERLFYRAAGVDPAREMGALEYTLSMLGFSLVGVLFLYGLLRGQAVLPLNPSNAPAMAPALAWNTAVSFLTNTNWQSYSGETQVSHLAQMFGLGWHNFVSGATGVALAIALVRGIARREASGVGNFWADLVRVTLYVLLPIALIAAVILLATGVTQTFHATAVAHTLEGATQTISVGPIASQEAIKQLGTNGGGFFNANSAHPFENPTPFSNLFSVLLILIIPSALTATFGRLVGDRKQGWALWAAMAIVFVGGYLVIAHYEQVGTLVSAPNFEGKEVRFGIPDTALFTTATTSASCGAVNAMHDSMTPIGGLVPMLLIQLGEIIFGGVGSGLYGMIVFALLAVFIAGLMVGRTPEYLGKKIEGREMKLAMLSILIAPLFILGLTAISVVIKPGTDAFANQGPHGFSEALYAYSSATGNNGSAFAGLNATNDFWLTTLGIAMLVGRFLMVIPVMAIAGALARKKRLPVGAGTLPTASPLFIGLLVGVILVVGALTFLPALALGPIVEHLEMLRGRTF